MFSLFYLFLFLFFVFHFSSFFILHVSCVITVSESRLQINMNCKFFTNYIYSKLKSSLVQTWYFPLLFCFFLFLFLLSCMKNQVFHYSLINISIYILVRIRLLFLCLIFFTPIIIIFLESINDHHFEYKENKFSL